MPCRSDTTTMGRWRDAVSPVRADGEAFMCVHVCSTGVSGVPRVKRCYDMPCMAGEENT